MKSLKEALLNRSKNVDVVGLAADMAKTYINDNYTVYGKLTFANINGVCIVNCDGDVKVKNKQIVKLTEEFIWGEVTGDFNCDFCNIKTLEGAPETVGGFFDCSSCKNLKTLKGAPKKVDGTFSCSYCDSIQSLVGGPDIVGERFFCTSCKNLKTLKGAPGYVGKAFFCDKCENLTSLEGAPKGCKIHCDRG